MVQPWCGSLQVCAIEFLYWIHCHLCQNLPWRVLSNALTKVTPEVQQEAGCENLPLIFTCVGHIPWMLAHPVPCCHCPTCCMCCPAIGYTTGVLWDNWAAIPVIWSVSTHCLVTGSPLVSIVVCDLCHSDCCFLGGCWWSLWPTTWNVFAYRPTSGASNLVNFKFNPYFVFVSSTLPNYLIIYTDFWIGLLNAVDNYVTKKVCKCIECQNGLWGAHAPPC